MTSCSNGKPHFTFSRHDQIGAAAAEDDNNFLSDCFIDTGDLRVLLDCSNPKRLIIGRTGAGKSALINEISRRSENTIQLSPHSLSLNYIANNKVIAFYEAAGVNLSAFYGLLWRHIFVVELLKKKFNITNEDSQKDYTRHIKSILYRKDKIKEQAVDYLEKWGNKFWLTTEERIKELTEKIENKLSMNAGAKLGIDLSIDAATNLSSEVRREIIEHGQRAVSEIQIRELENIIDVLAEHIFNDNQKHYYLTIDMLDEEWADERIKFKLIKSLIDTVRRFKRIPNVKIISALRFDLLDKVLHSTREPGFQEEKYESLYLYLKWDLNDIKNLLEKRINILIKRKYTKGDISFNDIFPSKIDQISAIEYISDRTFLRPRDAILFLNECILLADGEPKLTASIVKKAEEQYSYKRLQSLATEWLIQYPNLFCVSKIFSGMKSSFHVSDITKDFLEEKYTDIVDHISNPLSDPISASLDKLFSADSNPNFNSIRNNIIREFYIVGLIGIKTGPTSTVNWSYISRTSISPGEIKPSSIINIHPMFYRALDTRVN